MEEQQEEPLPSGCAETGRSAYHPRSRRHPGATTTMAATQTTAGTATSPEKYLCVEEEIIQKFCSSSTAYSTEDVAMDSPGHQGHGGLGDAIAVAAAQTAAVEAAPEAEKEYANSLVKQLENERMERMKLTNALTREMDKQHQLKDNLRRVKEEKENLRRERLGGRDSPCFDNRACSRCRWICKKLSTHCPVAVAKEAVGRSSYCQFKNNLSICDGIKHNLSPEEILDLEGVKSIQSSLSQWEKKLCVDVYLDPLVYRHHAEELNRYCNFLVDEDITLELIRESYSTIVESHRPKFPDLSIFKLKRGLSRYYKYKWLLNSEGVNVLSTDSENRLKLMFKTQLSQDLEDVQELPDFFDLLE